MAFLDNGDCKKKKKKKKPCKAYSFQDMLGVSVRNTSHVKPIISMFVFELLDVEQYFSISVHFQGENLVFKFRTKPLSHFLI